MCMNGREIVVSLFTIQLLLLHYDYYCKAHNEEVSIRHALLEDMIPSRIEKGQGSICSRTSNTDSLESSTTTTFRIQRNDDNTYSVDNSMRNHRNRWDPMNAKYEPYVFLAEMDSNNNNKYQDLSIRFGRGGNIYSLYNPKFGEAIPPQGMDFAPFVDDVLQTVAVDVNHFDVSTGKTDYYIHQAGSYMYRPEKLPLRPTNADDSTIPFYSPSLGMECMDNTCSFISWGQQSHIPTTHRSDVLYFHRYTNCGSGIIEYTQVMQYIYGAEELQTRTNENNDNALTHFYINSPWVGIRKSNLPDIMLSNSNSENDNSGQLLNGKVFPMPLWSANTVIDASNTGGFTTFALHGKPSDTPIPNLVKVPCVEPSGVIDQYCHSPTSLPLIFTAANASCSKQYNKNNDRYNIKCQWPQNPHKNSNQVANIRGCFSCGGQKMKIAIKRSTTTNHTNDNDVSIQINHIQDWNRNGYVIFELSVCTYIGGCPTPPGHDGYVHHVNQLFHSNQEIEFYYDETDVATSNWKQSPSLTFVHGRGWMSKRRGSNKQQNIQFGQGGGHNGRRDMTVFTLDSNVHLYPGESFISRQYLLADKLGNVEDIARRLVSETYSTIITNELRNNNNADSSSASNFVGGRKIQIYANSETKQFGVIPSPIQGGQTTTCEAASSNTDSNAKKSNPTIKIVCEGNTVPKKQIHLDNEQLVVLQPFFYIECGKYNTNQSHQEQQQHYFGPSQYHFTPYYNGGEGSFLEPYICKNTAAQPKWKLLGYFPPNEETCKELQNYVYKEDFCKPVILPRPSQIPSIRPSQTPHDTIMLPSNNLLNTFSTFPSIVPSAEPSTQSPIRQNQEL